MPKVKLDIAGMYFSIEVEVAADGCVKDVLDAAAVKTRAQGYVGPRFRYGTENIGTFQSINAIQIDHVNGSAVSRQNSARKYKDGVYRYDDDMLEARDGAFVPADPNRTFVLAWQYYVYDASGVEHARKNGASRKVTSFADRSPSKGYSLAEGSTVVLRLIAIFVRPTH